MLFGQVHLPSNIIVNKLIGYAGTPIAAPSANISGKPSETCLEDIESVVSSVILDEHIFRFKTTR